MRIFVGGSLLNIRRDEALCKEFVSALGIEIVKRGHVLLNGCRSSLDLEIAKAAQEWLISNARIPAEQITGYCLSGDTPVHTFGRARFSALSDWQMNHPQLRVPEQIELAAATIFVAGNEGTFWAKNWAFFARKPILGVPRFGGSGKEIYDQELERLRGISATIYEDFETLNQLSTDMSHYAEEVVDLAERLIIPRSVFPIMSFKRAFCDVYDSYQQVCKDLQFEVQERTDESTSTERIIPRIEKGIRHSAFVIADITELSPNVFFEVGFAKALGKDVILTAREGTVLPFDVSDIPTIFWDNQRDLKENLRARIKGLKKKYEKYGR